MNTRKRTSNFKIIRISILLLILIGVWKHFDSQKKIIQNWKGTQDLVITPINYDQSSNTQEGIARLTERQFYEINEYFGKQAKRYNLNLSNSIRIRLGKSIDSIPPALPPIGASRWDIILWSLRLRWWAWQNQTDDSHSSQINLFVMYSSPEKGVRLPHSTGLQKGLIGLIHASAHQQDRKRNNMIITHELLHIFGASDKYDLRNGRPTFPYGYAQPNKNPRYPQSQAEIMAGRTPINQTQFGRVYGLSQTIIGEKTAREIGWIITQN